MVTSESNQKSNDGTKEQTPEFVIVMGGVCTGKTTFRKEKFADGYTHIDAGEIFIQLSQGQYYDFPCHLEEKMNQIGLDKMRESLKNRKNIVIEIIGENKELLINCAEKLKKLNYSNKLILLQCEPDTALKRNADRDNNNISAYYCEPYHFGWVQQAVEGLLNVAS